MNTFAKRRKFLKKMLFFGCMISICIFMEEKITQAPQMSFVRDQFKLMGTDGKIQVFDENCPYDITLTIAEAIRRINELEKVLSKFNTLSDITKLNMNPFIYQDLSDDTLKILHKSINYSAMTDGYFNIGVGNFLSLAGIDTTVPLIGSNFFNKNYINKELIKIKNNKVKLLKDNIMLDLGGIGKGYALDEAMNILVKKGIKHAAIEFGGDIKVLGGMPQNKPWNIIVNTNTTNDIIKLHTGCISVSGGYLKKSTNNVHNIYHHIIDPKTLTSKDYYSSILVIGPESTTCDVLSTACFNMTISEIESIQKKFPEYEIKTYI